MRITGGSTMRQGIHAWRYWLSALACAVSAAVQAAPAPRIRVVHSFAPGEARNPGTESTLFAGPGHLLYGVSGAGGSADQGTVFSIDTKNYHFRNIYSFERADGGLLGATGAAVGPLGAIYVTTYQGGASEYGEIFRVNPFSGEAVVIHEFQGSDAGLPVGPLIRQGGYFYGVSSSGEIGMGTAYRFDPSGNVEALHQFPNTTSPDETLPTTLSSGPGGVFYGATYGWPTPITHGAVYSLLPDGEYQVLHYFTGPEGDRPFDAPVVGPDGNLYGTTEQGGEFGAGVAYRLRPDGQLDVLHSFDQDTFGGAYGNLTVASNGRMYGVTFGGRLFELRTNGSFRILLTLTDSNGPDCIQSSLTETEPGVFFGTSECGGVYNQGTIYKITLK
jgi:uncharacterized repeat protein (TIGR03803 family)